MFGSNGQDRKLDGGVIERFTRRAPDDFEANKHVKVIVNPRRVNKIMVPHCAIYYAGNVCINENGLPIPYAFNQQNTVEKIQINHYHTKSREEYIQKAARGFADQETKRTSTPFDDYQNDVVEDLNALEIFQKPSFRREIYRDDESTIHDLKFMLAEENPDIELLLTCFHRAHGLKDESQRLKFESESLEKIFQIKCMLTYDSQLFADSLPELLTTSTQYRRRIAEYGIQLLQMLEGIMRHNFQYVDQFDFWRRREWLELFK